jgi:drug/metabolite transporter (DMT)-like permease
MSEAAKKNYLTGFLLTLTGSILFSTKAIFVKLAFANTDVDAVTLLALRMAFAVPFYIGIAFFYSNRRGNTKFSKQQWLKIIFLGFIGYYLSSLFDFIGLQYISAGLERLILFLYPTFAILLNAMIYKQKISRMQFLALLLTYTGIAVAYFGELDLGQSDPLFFKGSFFIFL